MEVVHIPGGMEHEAEVLEDSLFFDLFHPVREHFLKKVEGHEGGHPHGGL